MISKFFNKSKPINYIVVFIVLVLVFCVMKFKTASENFDLFVFFKNFSLFLICALTVFVFDFLVSKNDLTKKNNYNIVLFVLFMALLPQTLLNTKILISNFFILLAFRRIISLRTQKSIKKKLFDASIWISIATLFYFWSSVFFVLIFIALITYTITDIKNYIIPFIGILTVVVISISSMIITDVNFMDYMGQIFNYSLDFSALNSKRIIISFTLLFSFGLWSLLYYIKIIRSKMKSYRPSFKLVIIAALLGFFILVVAPSKNGSEFIFLFAPLAIIITNYLEVISEIWFKEFMLWIMVITPIALLLL